MNKAERRSAIVRENALQWAIQTAMLGEDPLAILARAQLYEEYILSSANTAARVPRGGPDRMVEADQL